MVTRKPLNKVEKVILKLLYKKDYPMTPNAISKETGLAYVTVRKYITKMLSEKIIIQDDIKEFKKHKKGTRSESKRYTLNPKIFN